jgi:hypothetical protein
MQRVFFVCRVFFVRFYSVYLHLRQLLHLIGFRKWWLRRFIGVFIELVALAGWGLFPFGIKKSVLKMIKL